MMDINRASAALATCIRPGVPVPPTIIGQMADVFTPLGLIRELYGLRITVKMVLPPAIQSGMKLSELERLQWIHRLNHDGLLDAAVAEALVAIWQQALSSREPTISTSSIATFQQNNVQKVAPEPMVTDLRKPPWAHETGLDKFGSWASLIVHDQVQVMRLIPAGSFQMGTNNGDSNERPVHTVEITRPFWLGDSPVTQGTWKAVMSSNPSRFSGDMRLPVDQVSWFDCQNFFVKLNDMIKVFSAGLPTESQWEYSCRAGTKGPYAGDLNAMAWYEQTSIGTSRAVKTRRPNDWGLYDMHGNVWEWCQDWYAVYASSDQIDPTGPSTGSSRVYRGGSWADVARFCRSENRMRDNPNKRHVNLGFRMAVKAIP